MTPDKGENQKTPTNPRPARNPEPTPPKPPEDSRPKPPNEVEWTLVIQIEGDEARLWQDDGAEEEPGWILLEEILITGNLHILERLAIATDWIARMQLEFASTYLEMQEGRDGGES